MWWVYRMPMKMKLIIALQPLLLALCWFAGSGILTRIETERQMENIAQLTALARRPEMWCMNCKKNGE